MKEIRLIMLGFGNAGKAFARLLNDKREEIADNYDCEIKVVAIITKSRGSLLNLNGIDILKAIKEIEDWGNFKNDDENYSEITSLDAVSLLDYDVMMELTPLNVLTGQPAKDHIMAALGRGKHVITAIAPSSTSLVI
jgi:homoserine dehydrogenase